MVDNSNCDIETIQEIDIDMSRCNTKQTVTRKKEGQF